MQGDYSPNDIQYYRYVNPKVQLINCNHDRANQIVQFIQARFASPFADADAIKTKQHQNCPNNSYKCVHL